MAANVEMEFFFRKEKLKDAEGKEMGEGKKLPAFKASLPVPDASELIAFLANPESPEAKLLLDAVENIVYLEARNQVNAWRAQNPEAGEVSPSAVDLDKLDFSVIANTPRESTGRSGVSEEGWASFYEHYFATMVETGEEKRRAQNQVDAIASKFSKVKNAEVLSRLAEKLNLYASAAGDSLAEHAKAFQMTTNRLQAAITKASEVSMDDIG